LSEAPRINLGVNQVDRTAFAVQNATEGVQIPFTTRGCPPEIVYSPFIEIIEQMPEAFSALMRSTGRTEAKAAECELRSARVTEALQVLGPGELRLLGS
jgi:hypothetical protein